MDPVIAAELQNLRAELRRTRRGLGALCLALFGVALAAQASGGPRELHVDRLVIGTAEKGMTLEVTEPSGPVIRLVEGQSRVHLQAHGGSAVVQVSSADSADPKYQRMVSATAGGPDSSGVRVQDQDKAVKNGAARSAMLRASDLWLTETPVDGKLKQVAHLP